MQQPVAKGEATAAAARNNQFLGPKCNRDRAKPRSGIRARVYAAMSRPSSSWLIVLGNHPPLVEPRPARFIAAPPQPNEPHERETQQGPEQPRAPRPPH